jgi:hypothetical protein
MNRKLILFALIPFLILVANVAGSEPSPGNNKMMGQENQSLEYRVWRFIPTTKKDGYSLAIVSVNPRHFNRIDMKKLAVELRNSYPKEVRFNASLFDSDSVPRTFVEGGLDLPTFNNNQRGRYLINRSQCKEYIRFFTPKGKSKTEEKIKFKCSGK